MIIDRFNSRMFNKYIFAAACRTTAPRCEKIFVAFRFCYYFWWGGFFSIFNDRITISDVVCFFIAVLYLANYCSRLFFKSVNLISFNIIRRSYCVSPARSCLYSFTLKRRFYSYDCILFPVNIIFLIRMTHVLSPNPIA